MLRLARTGKKKQAQYRLIVSDKTKDTFGDNLEILGSLDPHQNPPKALYNADRVTFSLGKGPQASARVHNLLVDLKIITTEKVKSWRPKKKEMVEEKAAPAKPVTAAPATPVAETKVEEVKPETPAEPTPTAAPQA